MIYMSDVAENRGGIFLLLVVIRGQVLEFSTKGEDNARFKGLYLGMCLHHPLAIFLIASFLVLGCLISFLSRQIL